MTSKKTNKKKLYSKLKLRIFSWTKSIFTSPSVPWHKVYDDYCSYFYLQNP